MPHVIVKLASGRSEGEKVKLAEDLTQAVIAALGCSEEQVSVGIDDVDPRAWVEKIYKPHILGKAATIYKKPGYDPH